MAISRELFLALLSMDAYNRGYAPGITGLSDVVGTSIGSAVVSKRLQNVSDSFETQAKDAGFYALSYTVGEGVDDIAPGTTVISYRGTDDPLTPSSAVIPAKVGN